MNGPNSQGIKEFTIIKAFIDYENLNCHGHHHF